MENLPMSVAEAPWMRFAVAALAILFADVASAERFGLDPMAALRMRMAQRPTVSCAARMDPAEVVVGQPCAIVLELTIDKEHGIESLDGIDGLPKTEVVYSQIENLADGVAGDGKVVKRFRIPTRFTAARDCDAAISVDGMSTVRQQSGNMSITRKTGFCVQARPFRIKVSPLPEKGRPPAFAGAVGTEFRLSQTLSATRVHIGDIVTATYRLDYDGYFPSNAVPVVEGLSREFKAYDVKQLEYGPRHAVWSQILVPRTTAATNTAAVALYSYNVQTKRYEVVQARPQTLTFVSGEAASTNSVSVVVATEERGGDDVPKAGGSAAADCAAAVAVELRLAPSESSPVVARLPAGTPAKVVGRHRSWRRLESAEATGWTK